MKYILTLIYLICTTGGITFMKLGGDSLKISLKNEFVFKIGCLTVIGFVLYFISFILWQKMIVKYDLSIMVPIVTGVVQVLVLLVGQFIFKESLNLISLCGAILIIIGIIIMALANK